MPDDLDSVDGGTLCAIGGGAGNGGQGEGRRVDGKHHVITVGIVGLDKGAIEIRVGGVSQVDARGCDARAADLVSAGPCRGAITSVGIHVHIVARRIRRKASERPASVV